MQPKDAKELLKKYREGTATDAEKELLGDWVLFGKLKNLDLTDDQLEQELNLLDEGMGLRRSKVTRLWPRIAAAASILLALSFGGYLLLHKTKETKQTQSFAQNRFHDIVPGGNKAVLTLDGGRRIVLTDAKNGKLAEQGNTIINKTQNGQVVYTAGAAARRAESLTYNTIETPRGGQYELTLSDGTKVWLNAASSIKYPAAFTGNSRQVEITGEAYFEVAHNAAKPFRVVSNGQTVEVLGTHFNVNTYKDEPATRTTLLEGSVKVSDGNGGAIIKPGEQAILKGNAISVVKTDVDDVVAWKNGLTTFENADIYGVMRQVSRWYNVKVVFEGEIPARHFSGAVSRSAGIGDVLKILELSKIHFRVDGKTITVTP